MKRLHCGRLHFLGLLCFIWHGGGCCAARGGQGKGAADSLQLFKQPNHLILSFPSESPTQHFKASLGSCLLLFSCLLRLWQQQKHVLGLCFLEPGSAPRSCSNQSLDPEYTYNTSTPAHLTQAFMGSNSAAECRLSLWQYLCWLLQGK